MIATVLVATTCPAAASEPEATPRAERAASERHEKKSTEHLRLGPLVGVGFPRPLEIEALAKIERTLGLGAEYSFMPQMNLFGADVNFKAVAADLRLFPFHNAFFIGLRGGRQWLDAKTTINAGPFGSFAESLEASTWFLNPRIGVLFTFASGLTVGVDAGVQIPIAPSYERHGASVTAGLATATGMEQTLATVVNLLGNSTTPTVDLLRLGFLF
jgi:hypothetical protein